MNKKERHNITIDSNVWAKAKAMNINCSSICEEALRIAVNLKDDDKEIMRQIEESRQIIAISEKILRESQENKNVIDKITGGEEAQFNKFYDILMQIYNTERILGDNHIAKLCHMHDIDVRKMKRTLLEGGATNIVPYTERGDY